MYYRSLNAGILALLWAALIGLAGCGPATDRLPLSGTVTLDGSPLDEGSIRLESRVGGKILVAVGSIKSGEFDIPREKGLPPGVYHVEISSPDTKAPLVAQRGVAGERGGPPTAPERIPAEYNVESKHTIEVTPNGENHFDFTILSRPSR